MRIAITGLPQSGRTTLWTILSAGHVGHRDNLSVVKMPDYRLAELARVESSKKITPIEVELIDTIGSIIKGGAIFPELQATDAIMIVLRGFDAGFGTADPIGDAQKLKDAMILFDVSAVNTRMRTLENDIQKGRSQDERRRLENELAALQKFAEILKANGRIYTLEMSESERKTANNQGLLTAKSWLTIISTEEPAAQNMLEEISKILDAPVIWLATKLEQEFCELKPEEADMFRTEMQIPAGMVENTILALKDAMNIIEFYTANEREAHAWAIRRGTTALEAAAKIHTDIARGFIRAELIDVEELIKINGYATARTRKMFRVEGKDYIMQDGHFVEFRFNV